MAEEKFVPKKKTYVEDIERTLYDIKDEDHSVYKTQSGLTEDIIRDISKRKNDPQWMLDFRLKSLAVYNSLALPTWGPDLSELNMDDIVTYVQPDAKMTGNWQDVPTDIKNTFDRLGIPEAEQNPLPVSARSTTRKSSTTASRMTSSSRASSTRTWRRPSASTRMSSRSTS